jgi:hypothetical protein
LRKRKLVPKKPGMNGPAISWKADEHLMKSAVGFFSVFARISNGIDLAESGKKPKCRE